jgi:gamma-glutamyl hydrolase
MTTLGRALHAILLLILADKLAAQRVPVVGILSQPLSSDPAHDYVAASYVKWCEAAGATTIAIPYNSTNTTIYDEVLTQIHGLLLPGGAAPLSQGVVYLLDQIRHANTQEGRYFPVWGTCLGFEFLLQYMGATLGASYRAENVSLVLEDVVPAALYAETSVYDAVRQQPLTLNNHHQGLDPAVFDADPVLSHYWQRTSINHDPVTGQAFVSTIEPVDDNVFPWYGVQYHPEKNAFEYATYPQTDIPYEAINHSAVAVEFSLHMARFWIARVRRSVQANPSHAHLLTTRYPPLYQFPVRAGRKFEQIHLIPKDYPDVAIIDRLDESRSVRPRALRKAKRRK